MFFNKAVKDRTQVITIANRLMIALMFMIGLLCLTTYHAVTNKVIIQLVPPHLDQRVTVAYNAASSEYHIRYGMYAAILMGNVNPETVHSIIDALKFLFSPALYQKTITEMNTTAANLVKEDSSIEFKPKDWGHESLTNLTFITGQQTIRSNIGRPKVSTVTYEYKFEVNNYVPTITHFALYPGPARDAKYRAAHHAAEQRK